MALIDALQEWEELWRAAGAPVDELLEPGISADEVRAALGRDFVHPDVLTWFAWHNGAAIGWNAVPSGRNMFDVDQLLRIRTIVRQSSEDIDPPEEEMQWRDSFFPLLQNDQNETVLVDLDTGEVVRHEIVPRTITSPTMLHIGGDLESVVRIWVEVLRDLHMRYAPWPAHFEVDRSAVPYELVRSGIVIV